MSSFEQMIKKKGEKKHGYRRIEYKACTDKLMSDAILCKTLILQELYNQFNCYFMIKYQYRSKL